MSFTIVEEVSASNL